MITTRKLALVSLLAFLLGGAVTYAAPKVAAGPWRVGIGKPSGLRASTSITSSGLGVDWSEACYLKDGSVRYAMVYSTTSNPTLFQQTLLQDAACTKITQAAGGAVVYTTTGGTDAVCTTASGVVTRVNSIVATGAAGGKLNLQ